MSQSKHFDYQYNAAGINHSHAYLLPVVDAIINECRPQRVFDLGCGNGSVANHLSNRCEVVGIDASLSAVTIANETYPELRIELNSAYEDLASKYGTFDMVISLEVVEHLYDPRAFARNLYGVLRPGGTAVISTPYHGYLKNVVLALTGKMDDHFSALWDGGHIKFWSIKTLTQILREVGLEELRFYRVGRVPPLARSMIAVARKPVSGQQWACRP
jgi:2-polyprenyl-3-methyl-5-hydroxy-6-metoxy-1,4-benzoquinol methylase